ncbi:MAG: hypothetical protein ACREV0_08280 [Burkholderiales bacterium]
MRPTALTHQTCRFVTRLDLAAWQMAFALPVMKAFAQKCEGAGLAL